MESQTYTFQPDYAVPPGETLLDVIKELGMTQKELATRTGLTVQSVNRITKGDQPITYETAILLDLSTGVPARIWNNLEALYRGQRAKVAERERLAADCAWLKSIPVRELINRGLIQESRDQLILLREVLAFYGVSSVAAWREIWTAPAVAARRSPCFNTAPGAASAWIRQGEIQAQKISCSLYNKQEFYAALLAARKLTNADPATFIPALVSACANTGVALVFVREMKGVPWNGATEWLTPDKAMILLNIRGHGEDKFWFSFFHEAGHVLYGHRRALYIADETGDEEHKADEFAADLLIPKQYNQRIASARTKSDISSIADELHISAGIVAGRFQYLTKRWDRFGKLINVVKWGTSSNA